MTRLSLLLVLSLGVTACSNLKEKDWHGATVSEDSEADSDADSDTDTDSDTDSDTDTDTDSDTDSDTDTDTGSDSSFDEPGDTVEYETDDSNYAYVDLADSSGDSNREQEFYLVVVNTGDTETGYRLRYLDSSSSGPPAPASSSKSVHRREPRARQHNFAPPPPGDVLTDADIGSAQHEFLVRNHLTDTDSFATVSSTLWALGDHVEIWVDNDVYVDWDYDCDGTIDQPAAYPAYGFQNCDLADVAQIMDDNIVPNLEALYGTASDVNGDDRVSIVITAQLNAITLTSDFDTDYTSVLPSYAEPEVDLEDFDISSNPGSDGQEVVYVYAPDPYGFYNSNVQPSVESYTGYQLAGEFARSYTKLISYNQHVIEGEGDQEEEWVVNGLGTLGADLCGFGAAYYDDVWLYLDAPHLSPLAADPSEGSLQTLNYGAQYLFTRWLYDRAESSSPGSGATLLMDVMQSGKTGTESIETAAGGDEIATLAVAWQVGMLTTGITNSSGDPLVDATLYPPIASGSTISAPPSSPGDHFGANGYQLGVNLYGENHLYEGGTTDTPTEITDDLVSTSNQYAALYAPGFEFFGNAAGGYGASIVRLTGITFDTATLELQGSGALVGAVVRWNDPAEVNYAVENIFSPLDVNALVLPPLPNDGGIITGEGEISDAVSVTILSPDGSTSTPEVQDDDRWLLDLTDRPATEIVPVAVWLKRHFSDSAGGLGPDDPWVAVVPQDLVPEPTVSGTQTNASCTGAPVFGYPSSVLEYLYYQQFLSTTMSSDTDFDPCGELPDDSASYPSCEDDWDLDGVADEDEAQPATLLQQIQVADCTARGETNETYDSSYSLSWMDADEQDEDDRPSRDFSNNAGGRSTTDAEEGFVEVDLPGGTSYLLIVGGNSGTGVYEINVRQTQH